MPGGRPRQAAPTLGYAFYAGARPHPSLAADWDDTNCILHGAMSITGLAVVLTGALPGGVDALTWARVLLALVLVEAAPSPG